MIVCSCQGVNDRTVRAAVAAGAETVDEVGERCRAGTRCGGCWPTLERLLADHRRATGYGVTDLVRRRAVA